MGLMDLVVLVGVCVAVAVAAAAVVARVGWRVRAGRARSKRRQPQGRWEPPEEPPSRYWG